jgi:predicted nucleic acid-binding protein
MTRPQPAGAQLGLDVVVDDIRRFASTFNVAEDGPGVTDRLLWLLQRHPTAGRQVHDANIVATMLVHDLGRLMTFNATDFRRFAGLIEVEP